MDFLRRAEQIVGEADGRDNQENDNYKSLTQKGLGKSGNWGFSFIKAAKCGFLE